MNQFKYIVFAGLFLAACAQAPQQKEIADQPDQSEQSDQPDQPMETPKVLPNVELSSDLLYQFLLSEVASQRGQNAIAVDGSLDLAKKTRDPRLAMRATHIALQSGDVDKAVEAIKIWREADPDSLMARRMMSSVLLRSGKLDEANLQLSSLLKVDEGHVAQNLIQIYQMLASYPDRPAALKLMRDLASPYPRVAEGHFGVAELAHAIDDEALSLGEAKLAHDLRPDWAMAVSLEAQLLQKSAPQQSLDLLRNFLSHYPDAREIRLQFARALLDQKQYKPARDEFQRMANDNPDNPDFAYAIALISLQMNDLTNAEKELKEALDKGKKDQDTVQFYLGQLSEAKKDEEEAITYYRAVKDGEYLFTAQVRAAFLLGKHGQLADARQQLQQVQPADDRQRAQLVLAEAQLLRDASQFDEAYKILNQALEKLPDQVDLLYETAMIADRLGKPDVFEKLMRKIIQIKPDHAQAYNALGYGLLERNERIPEAMQLVEKAMQLLPNDAAIMDSMGWGYYRSGKLDDSVKMLRRAFEGNPDPEIAAHLGEVLWVRGDKDEAKKIWQSSLKANPGNAPLQAAIKKFDP